MFLEKISKIWFVNYASTTWFFRDERLSGGMLATFWHKLAIIFMWCFSIYTITLSKPTMLIEVLRFSNKILLYLASTLQLQFCLFVLFFLFISKNKTSQHRLTNLHYNYYLSLSFCTMSCKTNLFSWTCYYFHYIYKNMYLRSN